MEPTATPAATSAVIARHFTTPDVHPFDTVEWERRDAKAGDFFQANVEVPVTWSDDSIGVVAKLYFATVDGAREDSVKQMISRVVEKITREGIKQGHFSAAPLDEGPTRHSMDGGLLYWGQDAKIFADELTYICVHQLAGFNTPTWLNIGVPGRKQCGHACYPLSIDDHMIGENSITEWWAKEAAIFKLGGGSGINLSRLRGSMEPLSTGGLASGPVVYIRPSNAGAETLKSGGAHRRAAKFICLDDDHPDLEDFIETKVREDRRMRLLAEAGVEDFSTFTTQGERNIAETTSFQSANHSVCVTDDFMRKASGKDRDSTHKLTARVTGETIKEVDARDLLDQIATAAHQCGDPGLIFIDTINAWHTTPSLGPVTTTNTCGEVTQNDDTACNLAALNVLNFLTNVPDPLSTYAMSFKVDDFRCTIDVMTIAMDIVCGFSELPTAKIQQNTRDLRQLGMGLTNLGAAIMAQGYAYDSPEGRGFAKAVTALLTGRTYCMSTELARRLGPFKHFADNREAMLGVIDKHMEWLPVGEIHADELAATIWMSALKDWEDARRGGHSQGFRNALATSMMPTGTVSFLLGCDTTGIEPAFSLVTYKKLAAAGTMKMVNRSAHLGAQALGGYSDENLKAMADGDFSMVAPEDKATFATAVGENFVEPMGHVRMVAALQPFVSQAISKTTNLPEDVTIEEIKEIYVTAWSQGVKVLSVYRDNSKATQVLSTKSDGLKKVSAPEPDGKEPRGVDEVIASQVEPRKRMPRTRKSITHKIHIQSAMGEQEGYLTVGMYDDGRPGEIFIEGFGKHGGFTQNALGAWATDFSIGVQYGVPWEVLCRKHAFTSDETGGMVVPPSDLSEGMVPLRSCYSIVDYIARWLIATFGDVDFQEEMGVMTEEVKRRKTVALSVEPESLPFQVTATEAETVTIVPVLASTNGHSRHLEPGPPCGTCGARMMRAGACWQCTQCGAHTGCG